MATYAITETVHRTLTVEADSEDEARDIFFQTADEDISEESSELYVEEIE